MALQHQHPMDLGVNRSMLQRWHPALLQQDDQLVQCGNMGQGSQTVWPGRIVGMQRIQDAGSHPMSAYHTTMQQVPSNVDCKSAAGCLMAGPEQLLGPCAGHFGGLPERQQQQQDGQPQGSDQYDAALAHHFACCSFDEVPHPQECGPMYGGSMDSRAGQDVVAGVHRSRTVLRFDSASSEYDLTRAGSSSSWGMQHILPPECMQRHGSSGGADLLQQQHSDSAIHVMEGQHPAQQQQQLLPERWDSAGPEAYEAERQGGGSQQDQLLADIVAGLHWHLHGNPAYAGGGGAVAQQQAASLQQPEQARCQDGDAPMLQLDIERAMSLEQPLRPQAGAHDLHSEERVRAPRRRKAVQQGGMARTAHRARRCLAAAFAAAADAQRLAPLDCTPTHSQRSPPHAPRTPALAPPRLLHCMADVSSTDQGHLASVSEQQQAQQLQHTPPQAPQQQQQSPPAHAQQPGCWRECELAEALVSVPAGILPDDAARAVIASVAFGLERLHADGLAHRHVCAHTVVLGERGCFDTARLGEGGCTAVLDSTGGFADSARVGHPLHQPPEVLRAQGDAPIVYTPAGDMWALGVLLFGLLTGLQPPFAEQLRQVPCAGLSVDALQRGVATLLRSAFAARQACYAAQVLVESLLQVDAAQRLSAAAVRVHPWVLGCTPQHPQSPLPPSAPARFCMTADARAWPPQPAQRHFSLEAQAQLLGVHSSIGRGSSLVAMQQLWQQQDVTGEGFPSYPMLPGMMGCGSEATPAFRGDLAGDDKGGAQVGTNFVAAWLQRVLGRCKQRLGSSSSALDTDELSEHITRELILHHL